MKINRVKQQEYKYKRFDEVYAGEVFSFKGTTELYMKCYSMTSRDYIGIDKGEVYELPYTQMSDLVKIAVCELVFNGYEKEE